MLEILKQLSRPITTGIVGMGAMGKGLLYQANVTPGFRCVAINDIVPGRAEQCAGWRGLRYEPADTEREISALAKKGILAVCRDPLSIATCPEVEVFIESSSGIVASGIYCKTAIEHGKHVIMMNAEADLAFGPYLLKLAKDHGVVYTSCDGVSRGSSSICTTGWSSGALSRSWPATSKVFSTGIPIR